MHWSRHRGALLRLLAAGRVGVVSDFDGTLSKLVVRADEAAIAPANALALDALLARGVPVALVSGRAVADLRARFLRGGIGYYGNHGLEYWDGVRVEVVAEVRAWREPLRAALAELGPFPACGAWVEDKGATAAVHYRATDDPAATAVALGQKLGPICARQGLQLTSGNMVWDIKPPLALDKGTAVRAVVTEQHLDGVLFLGDDRTDLAAMAELRRLRESGALRGALSVGVVYPVGNPPELREECDLTADGVDDVARLLGWLVEAIDGCDRTEERDMET